MPFNSSIYTDLELPSLNQDNSTYGTIINTYFQALETKLKAISDRINAAGVGDSSTLAQINSDITEVNSNISGILPDPYSGNYTTLSSWPSYNTELAALGLSPPETASEVESFFAGSDITSFVNFLDGKLDDINDILDQVDLDIAASEVDVCKANIYSAAVTSPSSITYRTISTYSLSASNSGYSPFSASTTYYINSLTGYSVSDLGSEVYLVTSVSDIRQYSGGSTVFTTKTTGQFQIYDPIDSWRIDWTDPSLPQNNELGNGRGTAYSYSTINYSLVEIVQGSPDVSGCG
jgi:hypothetical protein